MNNNDIGSSLHASLIAKNGTTDPSNGIRINANFHDLTFIPLLDASLPIPMDNHHIKSIESVEVTKVTSNIIVESAMFR